MAEKIARGRKLSMLSPLGAHVSTAGGYEQAITRAESLGCTAFQIFTKSNRQWHGKAITAQEASLFRSTLTQSPIKPQHLTAHATYLINIGSAKPDLLAKSRAALIDELTRCDLLGIPSLVLHPGSATESTEKECLARISESLELVLNTAPGLHKNPPRDHGWPGIFGVLPL